MLGQRLAPTSALKRAWKTAAVKSSNTSLSLRAGLPSSGLNPWLGDPGIEAGGRMSHGGFWLAGGENLDRADFVGDAAGGDGLADEAVVSGL